MSLRAEEVSRRYGPVVAVDRVSVEVPEGECLALVGESGSGKSTLLRMFNRMVDPDSGRVLVDGEEVRGTDPVRLRRSIGYVPQNGGLMPHWTALRNAALVPWLEDRPDPSADAAAALEMVGLAPASYGARYPAELSGGQRQRVAIARALAARPRLLLLDEPFGALDAITRSELHELFGRLRAEIRTTTVLVTHDLAEAATLGDQVAVLRNGRLEQAGPPREVFRSPGTAYVADLVRRAGVAVLLVLAILALPAPAPAQEADAAPVVVASKPFGESYLLAEMFAQTLEASGIEVERRAGLGATEIAFGALRAGAIDVYPEYTGTGLLAVMGEEPKGDARDVYLRVARAFPERWGVHWLPPLGFENTYAIAVRRETAERLGLRNLTDLARAAPSLAAGFTPDFIGRADGLAGLQGAYGLRFRDVRSLLQSVKYQALAAGEVDVIDGYSTDGLIARYDLVVLPDDRGFFPPYEAAALVSRRLHGQRRDAVAALSALSGRIDAERMRRWNARVETGGEEIPRVAAEALREVGVVGGAVAAGAGVRPGRTEGSLAAYFWDRRALLGRLVLRHLQLVSISLLAATLVAVPLGLALERLRRGAETAIRATGLLQTIPSIALLAFMIPLLGIGVAPALVALFLYSLYPITRNTYTGVRGAAPEAVEAALALGMTPGQVLRHVRLPLAAPVVAAGIRTAAVLAVGTATLAAFIGAGGLGDPIVSGLALSDTRMILFGAIPAALLAFAVDLALAAGERAMVKR